MRLGLAVLVVYSCSRSARPPTSAAIANRGGTAPSCALPARFEFEARRYANLDHDDKDYQVWSAWRVGLQLNDTLRGTIAMVGDDLTWSFDVAGTLDANACVLELATDTHEPIRIRVDVAAHTGSIHSIDDEWLLGPPFPAARP